MGFFVMHILRHSSGRCSFRQVIPEALRPFCEGKHEHKVSIGREGEPGFLSRYEAAKAEYDAMIKRARKLRDGTYDTIDTSGIARLASRSHWLRLAEDEEARFSADERELFQVAKADLEARGLNGAVNWDGTPTRRWAEKRRETLNGMLSVYKDLRAIGDVDGMIDMFEDEVEYLLERENLVLDPNDQETVRLLCRALNDKAIVACQEMLARLDGEDIPTPPEPHRTPKPVRRTHMSLRELYEAYAIAQGLKPNTRDEWRRYIERLIEFLGHDDAARLTTEDLLKWRDLLLATPTRHGKPRSAVTVRDKYITSIRALLNWALEERKLTENVAAPVVVRVKKKPKLRERDFTQEEAKAILKATLLPQTSRISPGYARARRWIPWLCAYTGARVNEFSQMRVEDVQEVDGIWAFRITPEAGTQKTDEARLVPIHEHIIAQGFLAVVKELGEGPIFFDPSRQKVDSESNRHVKKVGEHVARWVRKDVGITDPNVMPNHGWRHTFKTLSYSAEIEERMADAIQGHSPTSVGRRYGRPNLKALADAMAKVERFELD